MSTNQLNNIQRITLLTLSQIKKYFYHNNNILELFW